MTKTPQQLADEKAMDIALGLHLSGSRIITDSKVSTHLTAQLISTHLLPLYECVEALRTVKNYCEADICHNAQDITFIHKHISRILSNLSTPTTKKKEGE